MKVPKRNNYLVSVVKDGKVTGLYWSESLVDLKTIKMLHKNGEVGVMDMKGYRPKESVPVEVPKFVRKQLSKNGKPFGNRVRCIETGKIYESVADASRQLGIPRINIYMAFRRGIAAYGYHFELLPPLKR